MKHVAEDVGAATVLVNNAGIVTGRPLRDAPDALMDLTMRVNAMAHWWTVKAVLPGFLESDRPCSLVTCSSMARRRRGSEARRRRRGERRRQRTTRVAQAALIAAPGMSDYSASKAASWAFDESVRFELAKLGVGDRVRTTVVCPYCISTGMRRAARNQLPLDTLVDGARRNLPSTLSSRMHLAQVRGHGSAHGPLAAPFAGSRARLRG